MPRPSFFERVRHARIVQVLVVYLGASWVVLQVTSTLQESMHLPEWLTPVAVLLLFVGLVVVLATAWVQSHAPAGPAGPDEESEAGKPGGWELGVAELKSAVMRGEVPHLTWARSLLGGVLAFSLLFGVAGAYVIIKDRGRTLGPAPVEAAVAPGVAVVPFTVTGEGLDSWREGMVDLLSTSLDGAGGMRAIDSRTVMARWRESVHGDAAPDLASALAAARATGAAYAVVGNAVSLGTRVRLAAHVYDLRSGSDLGPAQMEGNADSVFALVDGLSAGVIQRMLSGEVPSLRRLSEVTTTSLVALKAFLEGESLFRQSDYTGAIAAYERAIEADTAFALALLHAAHAYGWAESVTSDRAQDYSERAVRHSDRLPEREALVARAELAILSANASMLDTLRMAVRRYPDDPELWYSLGDMIEHLGAQTLADPNEGRQALEHAVALDPEFTPYRIHLVEHAIGSLDRAAAERALVGYDSGADRGTQWRGLHLAYDLTYGDSATTASNSAALDTVAFGVLLDADLAMLSLSTVRQGTEIGRVETSRPKAGAASAFRLASRLLNQGKLSEAAKLADQPFMPLGIREWTAYLSLRAGAPPLSSSRDPRLALPSDTVLLGAWWPPAAYAADRGDWAVVAAAMDSTRAISARRAAQGDSTAARHYADLTAAMGAYSAWRRGGRAADAARALATLQSRFIGFGPLGVMNTELRWLTAEAYAESGRTDAALRYFRALPNDALAHLRMAQLFASDQPDSARAHLGIFLAAWQDADPGLAPLSEAQQLAQRLGADRPR